MSYQSYKSGGLSSHQWNGLWDKLVCYSLPNIFKTKLTFVLLSCLENNSLLIQAIIFQATIQSIQIFKKISQYFPNNLAWYTHLFSASNRFSPLSCLLSRWSLLTLQSFIVTPRYFKLLFVRWMTKTFFCVHTYFIINDYFFHIFYRLYATLSDGVVDYTDCTSTDE